MAAAGRCGASDGAFDALARTGCNEPLDCAVGAESFAERCMANHAPAPTAMAATATAIGTRVLRDNGGAACGRAAGAATALLLWYAFSPLLAREAQRRRQVGRRPAGQ